MNNDDRPETMRRRILAVDLLRGIVMMIMLLDHTRDYVHAGALQNDPTDPATTTVAIFFTRWITHYCAPIFVFLSGVSIYLQLASGKSRSERCRFLWTRGLWLILLEFTVVRFLVVFNLDYSFFGMAQVIWVIGLSMIAMAALIYLPVRAVAAVGLTMVLLHNLLDGIAVPPAVAFAGTPPPDLMQSLWLVLHQTGVIPLFGGASRVFVAYPLIPWTGVMAAGYAVGSVYSWDADLRRKLLLRLGIRCTALFVIVRLINIYGDPAPWSIQASTSTTILSFFNVTKYPPSLLFLLMTLGPALVVLALTDGIDGKSIWQRVCIIFGKVPMFYYLLQWLAAHGFAVVLTYLAGKDPGYLFLALFDMAQEAPPGHGFPLWVVYIVWITGLVVLFPLCLYYGRLKNRSRHWLFSYL